MCYTVEFNLKRRFEFFSIRTAGRDKVKYVNIRVEHATKYLLSYTQSTLSTLHPKTPKQQLLREDNLRCNKYKIWALSSKLKSRYLQKIIICNNTVSIVFMVIALSETLVMYTIIPSPCMCSWFPSVRTKGQGGDGLALPRLSVSDSARNLWQIILLCLKAPIN